MSSRRSASEGTRIGTTESRWKRSSRKRPSVIASAKIPAGRRDDAHVDRDARGAADALKVLIDQHTQDFRLRLARHVGDLVEIKRAAVRLLERADPGGRIGACLDPEQFGFHPFRRHRRRVDDDEGPVGARRAFVDEPAPPAPCPSRRRPEMRTRELAGPSFSMIRLRLTTADDDPTIRLTEPPRARSSLTSRLRREVSNARSAIRIRRSALNGFSMKS